MRSKVWLSLSVEDRKEVEDYIKNSINQQPYEAPAFPTLEQNSLDHLCWNITEGLSKREWFAGLAMQTFLSNEKIVDNLVKITDDAKNRAIAIAISSFVSADAMIEESKINVR